MNHKLMLALALAAASSLAVDANAKKPTAPKASTAAPAPAEVATDVAPPSGTWEREVAPANAHVWSRGYYEWKDARFSWKSGEWTPAREGMDYRQHHWIKRADGKYVLTGGDWIARKGKDEPPGKP